MNDEKDIDLYVKMAKMEAKIEVIEKQNEKIEKLVESNYTLSNSIEVLAAQVATYDKKTELLMQTVEETKTEIEDKMQEEERRLATVEDALADLSKAAASNKTNVDKLLKQQQEIEFKGYKTLKTFFTQFKDKTQTAIIAAIVAGLGYVACNVLEYVVKMVIEK